MGEWEGYANPECPQKSGGLEAPRSHHGGEGAGEDEVVPQHQRRAPLKSLHPLGLSGRLSPSSKQGVVEGVRGEDRGVAGMMGSQVVGVSGEWQQGLSKMVSDCCVPRAPGGPGEGKSPAQEFGNGQRQAANREREDQSALLAPQTPPPTFSPQHHHIQCLGSAPHPEDQCCYCYCCYCCCWCRGGQGAGKGRKARRR